MKLVDLTKPFWEWEDLGEPDDFGTIQWQEPVEVSFRDFLPGALPPADRGEAKRHLALPRKFYCRTSWRIPYVVQDDPDVFYLPWDYVVFKATYLVDSLDHESIPRFPGEQRPTRAVVEAVADAEGWPRA